MGGEADGSVTLRYLVTWKIAVDFAAALLISVPLVIIAGLLWPHRIVVFWAWLAFVVVAWAAFWLRTSVRFTEHDIAVTMWLRPYRVRWEHVSSVSFGDVYDYEAERVTRRKIQVRYPRHPRQPVPPVPAKLGDALQWSRTNFRTLPLPLTFPLPGKEPTTPRTRIGRSMQRKRQIVRQEFAARGYPLPD